MGAETMNDPRFDDALLWSPDALDALEVGSALLDEDFRGLFLRVPAAVPMSERSTVPAAIWQVESLRDLAARSLRRRGRVVIVDTLSGEVRVGFLRDPEGEDPPAEPLTAAALEMIPEGASTSEARCDLVAAAGLPWRPGDFLVTVVLLDRASNRAAVSLRPSAASEAFRDTVVDAFIATEFQGLRAPPVSPLPGLTSTRYLPAPGVPPTPDAPGITLAIDRAVPQRPGVPWRLHGAWRLPLCVQDIVREPDATHEHLAARGHPYPTAVLPVTLLLTGPDSLRDLEIELSLPSFDPIDPAAPPGTVTGCFSVDLLELVDAPPTPQPWFLYAFSREVMTGPVRSTLIDASLLPPR